MVVNTGRREAVFPKARGFRRLWRPGSMVRALRAEPWVPPTERAGSEGVFEATFRWENRKTAPAARRKNKQTALAGDGNAPLLVLTHHFHLKVGKGTGFVGGATRPENPVTCFPVEKRLTMICASLSLLHPLLSLTHWIFGALSLPYKSSSLVQLMFAVHAVGDG